MEFWTSAMEKQVGARVQIVLDDPALMSVYQAFGAAVLRRSSVFHGLAKFLTDNDVSGERCFEIGTWNGLTAAILSRHFKEVVTVDIAHNAVKHEILRHLGIKNVRCLDIKDNGEKLRIARDTDFDFAYLDGNHADDTAADWGMTKHCGRVLFDEAWPFQMPVWTLVHSLPSEEVTFGGMGLALWRKA